MIKQREPSMYKRLSSHITSIDLPDLPDLPDAFRETASRVESALQHARSSYESHTRKEKEKGDKKDGDKSEKKENENIDDKEKNEDSS
nr:uncharacterized protein LOC128696348 [Cherax quadricarinatus]